METESIDLIKNVYLLINHVINEKTGVKHLTGNRKLLLLVDINLLHGFSQLKFSNIGSNGGCFDGTALDRFDYGDFGGGSEEGFESDGGEPMVSGDINGMGKVFDLEHPEIHHEGSCTNGNQPSCTEPTNFIANITTVNQIGLKVGEGPKLGDDINGMGKVFDLEHPEIHHEGSCTNCDQSSTTNLSEFIELQIKDNVVHKSIKQLQDIKFTRYLNEIELKNKHESVIKYVKSLSSNYRGLDTEGSDLLMSHQQSKSKKNKHQHQQQQQRQQQRYCNGISNLQIVSYLLFDQGPIISNGFDIAAVFNNEKESYFCCKDQTVLQKGKQYCDDCKSFNTKAYDCFRKKKEYWLQIADESVKTEHQMVSFGVVLRKDNKEMEKLSKEERLDPAFIYAEKQCIWLCNEFYHHRSNTPRQFQGYTKEPTRTDNFFSICMSTNCQQVFTCETRFGHHQKEHEATENIKVPYISHEKIDTTKLDCQMYKEIASKVLVSCTKDSEMECKPIIIVMDTEAPGSYKSINDTCGGNKLVEISSHVIGFQNEYIEPAFHTIVDPLIKITNSNLHKITNQVAKGYEPFKPMMNKWIQWIDNLRKHFNSQSSILPKVYVLAHHGSSDRDFIIKEAIRSECDLSSLDYIYFVDTIPFFKDHFLKPPQIDHGSLYSFIKKELNDINLAASSYESQQQSQQSQQSQQLQQSNINDIGIIGDNGEEDDEDDDEDEEDIIVSRSLSNLQMRISKIQKLILKNKFLDETEDPPKKKSTKKKKEIEEHLKLEIVNLFQTVAFKVHQLQPKKHQPTPTPTPFNTLGIKPKESNGISSPRGDLYRFLETKIKQLNNPQSLSLEYSISINCRQFKQLNVKELKELLHSKGLLQDINEKNKKSHFQEIYINYLKFNGEAANSYNINTSSTLPSTTTTTTNKKRKSPQ